MGIENAPLEFQVGASGGTLGRMSVLTPVDTKPDQTLRIVSHIKRGAQEAQKIMRASAEELAMMDIRPGTELVIQEIANLRAFSRLIAGYDKQFWLNSEMQARFGVDVTPADLLGEYALVLKWLPPVPGSDRRRILAKLRHMGQVSQRVQLALDFGLDLDTVRMGREIIDKPTGLEFFSDNTGIPIGRLLMDGVQQLLKIESRWLHKVGAEPLAIPGARSRGREREIVFEAFDPKTPEGLAFLQHLRSYNPMKILNDLPEALAVHRKKGVSETTHERKISLGPIRARLSERESEWRGTLETQEGGKVEYQINDASSEEQIIDKLLFPETRATIRAVHYNAIHMPKIKGTSFLEISYNSERGMTEQRDVDRINHLLDLYGIEIDQKNYRANPNTGFWGLFSKYGRTQQNVRLWILENGLKNIAGADRELAHQAFSRALIKSLPQAAGAPWMSDEAPTALYDIYRGKWCGDRRSDPSYAYYAKYKRVLANDKQMFLMADVFADFVANLSPADITPEKIGSGLRKLQEVARLTLGHLDYNFDDDLFFWTSIGALGLMAGREGVGVGSLFVQGSRVNVRAAKLDAGTARSTVSGV